MANLWPPPNTFRQYDYDPDLVSAVIDELRLKLNQEIDQFFSGAIKISLTRSNQYVNIAFDMTSMIVKMSPMPDQSRLGKETYNLFDSDFDPVKTICRYVDAALKLEASYERKVNDSSMLLNALL